MNYTSYTALIITFHHMSAVLTLILAAMGVGVLYVLFLRKRKNRLMLTLLGFFMSLIISSFLAEEVLQKQPISLEVVQAG